MKKKHAIPSIILLRNTVYNKSKKTDCCPPVPRQSFVFKCLWAGVLSDRPTLRRISLAPQTQHVLRTVVAQ